MCLLSKSQFWSNATKNVKNQLPIGFGPGDFSRNKRFEHFFFFLPCAFFFPKSRYGNESALKSALKAPKMKFWLESTVGTFRKGFRILHLKCFWSDRKKFGAKFRAFSVKFEGFSRTKVHNFKSNLSIWSRPYKSIFKQEIFSHRIHNGGACFLDYLREKPRTAKVNNAGKNGSFSKEYRSYLLDVKGKALKQWGQILYEVFNNKVQIWVWLFMLSPCMINPSDLFSR